MRYLYVLITVIALLVLRGRIRGDVPLIVDSLFALALIALPLLAIRRWIKPSPGP